MPNGFPATLRDFNAMSENAMDRLLWEYRVKVPYDASLQGKRQLLWEFITTNGGDVGDQ